MITSFQKSVSVHRYEIDEFVDATNFLGVNCNTKCADFPKVFDTEFNTKSFQQIVTELYKCIDIAELKIIAEGLIVFGHFIPLLHTSDGTN